jgi:hypothetical protein
MKTLISFAVALIAVGIVHAEVPLVGGTVIIPADGKVLPNATVVINGDKIERVAATDAATGSKSIAGKFILPGHRYAHSFSNRNCLRDRTVPTVVSAS